MAGSPEPRDRRHDDEPQAALTLILWLVAAWLAMLDLVLVFTHSIFGG
jgi:hypothetical protein